MTQRHSFRPECAQLEPRCLLTTIYPIGFIGPLPPGGVMGGPLTANPLTIVPNPLNLGQSFTATLNIPTPNGYLLTGTTWTYDYTYKEYTTGNRITQGGPTSMALAASAPGTYKVDSTSTYHSTQMPPGPDLKIQEENAITAPAASTAKTTFGVGVRSTLGLPIVAQDLVTTGLGKLGPFTGVTAQEDITDVFYPQTGEDLNGTDGWVPDQPSNSFQLINSVISDAIAPDPDEWVKAAPGVFAEWTQQLRTAWVVTGTGPGGVVKNWPVSAPLNSLYWSIVKIDDFTWELDT